LAKTLKPKPWTGLAVEDFELAKKSLLNKGYIVSEIAEQLGFPSGTVRSWFNKGKVPSSAKRYELIELDKRLIAKPYVDQSFEWDRALLSMLEKGYTQAEIASLLGIRSGTMYGYLAKAKGEKSKRSHIPPKNLQNRIVEFAKSLKPRSLWRDACIELLNKGYTAKEIADNYLDRSYRAVSTWFKQARDKTGRGPSLEYQQQLIGLAETLPAKRAARRKKKKPNPIP